MLKVLCAEDSHLCLGGGSTCAEFTAMPDGISVLSKAHAYMSNRKHQTLLASTLSYLGLKYDGVEDKNKYLVLDMSVWYLAKYYPIK